MQSVLKMEVLVPTTMLHSIITQNITDIILHYCKQIRYFTHEFWFLQSDLLQKQAPSEPRKQRTTKCIPVRTELTTEHLHPTSHTAWEPDFDGTAHVLRWHPVPEGALNACFRCGYGITAIVRADECPTLDSGYISWIGLGQPATCKTVWHAVTCSDWVTFWQFNADTVCWY